MTTNLKIEGMTCQMCVRHVREALEAIPGVTSAQVDLDAGSAVVDHDSAESGEFIAAVEEEGYQASLAS